MPNVGPMELIIILIIALVVFGPKRLPELGRSLGNGMREFKDSVTGRGGDDDEPPPESEPPDATAPQQLPSSTGGSETGDEQPAPSRRA